MRSMGSAGMLSCLFFIFVYLFSAADAATVTGTAYTGSYIGATLNVAGSGFTAGCIVQFGSGSTTSAASTYSTATLTNCNGNVYVSTSQISCVTPALSAGTYYVFVLCSGTAQTTSTSTYVPTAPTVGSLTVSTGTTSTLTTLGGTTLTVTGTNYGCGCTVGLTTSTSSSTSSSIACTSPTSSSSTQMTCTTPSGLAVDTAYTVWVTCNGIPSAASAQTVTTTTHTITAISPTSGSTIGQFVTITGTNFGSTCTVSFNTAVLGTYYPATGVVHVSSTSITAYTGSMAATTAYRVHVTCGSLTTVISGSGVTFTTAIPTVTGLILNGGSSATASYIPLGVATTVTVVGTNIGSGCVPSFGTSATVLATDKVECTSYANTTAGNAAGTQVSCVLPATMTNQLYYAHVTCGASSDNGVTSPATLLPLGVVTIASVSPSTGAGRYAVLTVTGTNFGTSCVVQLATSITDQTAGALTCGATAISSTSITCIVSTQATVSTVYYPWVKCGTGGAFFAPPPTVTFTPAVPTVTLASVAGATASTSQSAQLSCAQTMTLTGTNFGNGCTVSFSDSASVVQNTVNCPGVRFISSTSLSCIMSPTMTAGAWYPHVACGTSQTVAAAAVTVTVAALASSASSAITSSSSNGALIGATVTVVGTKLGTDCVVALTTTASATTGGVTCQLVSASATQLVCIAATMTATTYYPYLVCTAGGTIGTSTAMTTNPAAPTVASISINGGTTSTSQVANLNAVQTITITGTGFGSETATAAASVTAGCSVGTTTTIASSASSTACTSVYYISSTQLTCTLPSSLVAGTYYAWVTCGASTNAQPTTNPAIVVTAVSTTASSSVLVATAITVSPAAVNTLPGTLLTIATTSTSMPVRYSGCTFSLASSAVSSSGAVACTNPSMSAAGVVTCYTPPLTAGTYYMYPTCGSNVHHAATTPIVVSSSGSLAISSVSPTTLSAAGGETVTLTGTSLTQGTAVTMCGVSAGTLSSGLTFTSNANPVGRCEIVVSGAANTATVTIAAPTVTSISPTTLYSTASGQTVTVTGTNLAAGGGTVTGSCIVYIGGTACTGNTVTGTTSIACTTPTLAAGSSTVAVHCNSVVSNTTTLTIVSSSVISSSALTTTQLNNSASVLAVSLSGSPIQITGTGFASSGCTVTVGGTTCTSPVYVSSTVMTCTTPTLSVGVYPVVVTCNSFVSTGNTFVNATVPAVTLVAPLVSALVGTPLTVTGTNFGTGCIVKLGASATVCSSQTWNSPTTITCITPVLSAATGIVVTVTCNSVVSTGTSIFFTAAAPTITAASPATIGLIGNTLTVTGTNFGAGCTIALTSGSSSSTCTSPTFVSSTTMTCTTPALTAASGIIVSVTCNSVATTSTSVTVTAAAPTVSAATTPIGLVGSMMTVTGSYFGTGCTVALTPSGAGSVPCNNVVVVSSTSITCVTPQLAAASGIAVIVTCNSVASGSSTTVTAAVPTITAVSTSTTSTSTVLAYVKTLITVSGTNFGAGCTIATTYSGTPTACATPTYVSETSMTCYAAGGTYSGVSGAGVSGIIVSVTCNTVATTSTSVTLSSAAPTVTGLAVDSATATTTATGSTAGSQLTITGTNFGFSDCTVQFATWCSTQTCAAASGSWPAVTYANIGTYTSTSLTVKAASMPLLPAGVYVVQVICGGITSSGTTTLYTTATPTLTAVSPSVIPALFTSTTYLLTLTGTNFGSQCTVLIGSTSCTNVAYVSTTSLTCQAPSMSASTTASVVYVTCNSMITAATTVTVTPTTPTVSGASPSLISLAGGSMVTVSGTAFASGCTASLNGVSCAYTGYISSSQLVCATPATTTTSTLDLPATVTCGSSTSTATTVKTSSGAPTVTSVVPAAITTAPATLVNITGTNFGQAGSTGCIAYINSIACMYTTVASSSSIICQTSSSLTAVTAGAVTVTCNSQTSNSTVTITVGAPTLIAVTPNTISTAGGPVVISGTNFASGCIVYFGGSSNACVSTSYTYTSTSITCTAPAMSSTTAQTVTVQCGTVATTATAITLTPTAPTVNAATPATITVAASTLAVAGTYFYTGCYVSLGATACSSTTFISSTSMTCITPTTLSPASYSVSVTCNGISSPTSSTTSVTVPAVKVTPSVTSVSPTSISTVSGQTITVYGTGLSSSCSVTIGGNACTSVTSSVTTSLTCVSPAFAAAGSVAVLVTCNSIESTESVRANIVGPTVSAVTAAALITQAGGQTATVTGTGFQTGCTITIGGITCVSPVVSGSLVNGVYTAMTCTTPALSGTSALQVQATCGTVKSSETFVTVTPSAGGNPVATTLTNTNPMSTYGGANITITGTGFGTGCTVAVGSAGACTNVIVASSGQLQCTAPSSGIAGAQNVIVTCGSLTPTTAIAVTYVAPTVTSATSLNVSTAGGFNATINGTGFISGCSVTVNGAACSGVTVSSPNSLTCIAPSMASGNQAVVVSCGLTSATNVSLAYVVPSITNLSPPTASTVGGSVIMINGTGFGPTCTFLVGGTSCTSVTFVSSTLMGCTVPALTTGTAVVVAQCGGTITGYTSVNTTSATLTIAPTVSTVTSSSLVTAAGGSTLTVNGAGFISGCSIILGTTPCTTSFSSTNQLTCVAPVLAAGPHAALVTCNNVSAIGRAVTIVYPSDNTTAPTVTNATTDIISTVGGTIYIGGTNFAAGCTATIGGTACVNLVALSSTLVTCTAAAPAAGGVATVQVTCGTKVSGNLTSVTYGAPTANAISPSSITTLAGSLMSISGTNFAAGCTVTIGGLECTSPTAVSSTLLNCTAPYVQIGTAAVVVKCGSVTATGLSVSVATFVKPTVTAVSVTTAGSPVVTAGATTVPITVTGSGFAAGCTVAVNIAACTSVTVLSPTSLTCLYPARASGNQNVVVTCGTLTSDTSANAIYVVAASVPTIASVSPSTLSTAGAPITITGTFFGTGCTATVGGFTCASPVVSSSTTMTCTAPVLPPGAQAVVVSCGSVSVDKVSITYVMPTVATAIAAAPAAMSPTTVITINGTNFATGCTVLVGYVACSNPTFTSTLVTCSLPAPLVAGQQVAVVTCGTVSAVSAINLAVPPQLSATRAPVAVTAAGNILQIVGAGFPSTTCTAFVNNVACFSTTYHSAEVLNCTVPSASVGSQNVTVTCGLVPSIDKAIAVYGPVSLAPQVMYLSTPTPLYMNGSLTVTINGTNFATGCSVSINGSACVAPNTWSPQAITCLVPAVANSGTASVIVTCTGNSNTMPITYGNYFDVPVVSTVNSVGTVTSVGTGGGNITINGTGYATGCVARVANNTCTLPAASGPRTMTCVAPANDVGSQSVAVICGNVTSNTNVTLSYVLPTLSSIAPTSISTLGNVSVTITGTGFGPFCSVAIAGKPCNTTQAITVTTIVCLAPANAAGSQKVSVTCGSYVAEDLKLTYVTPINSPPPPGVASPPGSNTTTNTFGQAEERKSMDLVFAGLDYTTMSSTSLLSFDLLTETSVCTSLGLSSFQCDGIARAARRKLLAGSVGTTMSIQFADGTSQDSMRTSMAALVNNINSNFRVVFADLLKQFPTITGVSARDVSSYDYGSSDDKKKKNLAIGLGVGLGVGIPLIAAVVFFCIWKSKRSAAGVVAPRGDGSA